ncbi:MAG: hypothetical protein ACXVEF_13050 [Polyangiales bacterium]
MDETSSARATSHGLLPGVRAFGGLLLAAAAIVQAGCGTCRALSTGGKAYSCDDHESPWKLAARASGARDLRCPEESVIVTPISDGKYPAANYLADGCGQRASYHCAPASLTQTCTMLLVSKFTP